METDIGSELVSQRMESMKAFCFSCAFLSGKSLSERVTLESVKMKAAILARKVSSKEITLDEAMEQLTAYCRAKGLTE